MLTNEFTVAEYPLNPATSKLADEALQQGNPFCLAGVAALVQHQPIHRDSRAFVYNPQRQDIDVCLAPLPVGTVKRQVVRLVIKKLSGKSIVRKIKIFSERAMCYPSDLSEAEWDLIKPYFECSGLMISDTLLRDTLPTRGER